MQAVVSDCLGPDDASHHSNFLFFLSNPKKQSLSRPLWLSVHSPDLWKEDVGMQEPCSFGRAGMDRLE